MRQGDRVLDRHAGAHRRERGGGVGRVAQQHDAPADPGVERLEVPRLGLDDGLGRRGVDGGVDELVPAVDVLEDRVLVGRPGPRSGRRLVDDVPARLAAAHVGDAALRPASPDLDVPVRPEPLVLEPVEKAAPGGIARVAHLGVRRDVVAHHRVHAVAGDHQVAGRAPSVRKHHLGGPVALLHPDHLGAHLHSLRADQLDQRALHVRPAHVTARRPQLARHVTDRHLLDQLALLVVDLGEFDRLPDPLRIVQSQLEQLLDRKRPQGEAGCPLLDVCELLVHLDVHPGAGQRQRARQSTDPASNDHHSVQLWHGGRCYPALRCTSPASSVTRPAAVSTINAPESSTPTATRPGCRWPSARCGRAGRRGSATRQDLLCRARQPRFQRPEQRRERLVNAHSRPDSASEVAFSSSGNCSAATFSPIPSTAQPSCGRPSTRMPATLRPSIQTSLGHLIAPQPGAPRRQPTAAASGSVSRQLARAPPTSAPPTRRRAPRAALAPAAGALLVGRHERAVRRARGASSRARSLVESVTPVVDAGLPIIGAAGAPRRRAAARAWRRRRRG